MEGAIGLLVFVVAVAGIFIILRGLKKDKPVNTRKPDGVNPGGEREDQ